MRLLVLNASPRKTGTLATLLREAVAGTGGRFDVEWVDVQDLNVNPCVGCMQCRPDADCVMPADDGHRIAQSIAQADALLVGTPTYWANMTGPLKVLFDRVVPALMGETERGMPLPRQKGKRAAVIATCTTPFPFDRLLRQSSGALRAVTEVLHYGGYRMVGKLACPGTKRRRGVTEEVLRKARRIGERL
jgi:NAD(P)H-dependent FMN reductase